MRNTGNPSSASWTESRWTPQFPLPRWCPGGQLQHCKPQGHLSVAQTQVNPEKCHSLIPDLYVFKYWSGKIHPNAHKKIRKILQRQPIDLLSGRLERGGRDILARKLVFLCLTKTHCFYYYLANYSIIDLSNLTILNCCSFILSKLANYWFIKLNNCEPLFFYNLVK